jgi:tripartite-type tricarboxylate transporter receptor subunit TctC
MRWLVTLGAILMFPMITSAAMAQEYPSRPIKLVVPWAPGGGIDNLARVVGEKLAQNLGQPVVIENRPGAASSVGTAVVAKAPPDGYTLILSNTTHAINATLYKSLPYDSVKDFAPIALLADSMSVLVVHPAFEAKSVKELIALAKSKPGSINYGSAGNGSIQHLAGELFKSIAGVDLVHVPYKAGGTVVTDLLSNRVSVYFPPMAQIFPMLSSGKLTPIAVTGSVRSPLFPNVPTMTEPGLPGFEVVDWYGVQAPAGTNPQVVTKLNSEFAKILSVEDMKQRLRARGYELAGGTPQHLGGLIQGDIKKWAAIIKASGAQLD